MAKIDLKAKLAALKGNKTETKKASGKKTAAAKKEPTTRKKPIGFTFKKGNETALNKGMEAISKNFEDVGETLVEFMEGKKSAATKARGALMDIIKTAKDLRNTITEAKSAMEPVYKEA